MGALMSRMGGAVAKAMNEKGLKDTIGLVHHYAKKGRKNFDDSLGEVEASVAYTLTPAERTAAWNAIQDFDRILQGFRGDILDTLVDLLMGKPPKPSSTPATPRGHQILLHIGSVMGWGTNLNTVFSNYNTNINKPLTEPFMLVMRYSDDNDIQWWDLKGPFKDFFRMAYFADVLRMSFAHA